MGTEWLDGYRMAVSVLVISSCAHVFDWGYDWRQCPASFESQCHILLAQERSKFKVQFRLNASLLHHVKFKNTKLNHHQSGTISVILWKYSSQRGRLKTGDGGGGGLVAKSRPTLATPWTVACRGLLCLWESLEWVAISFSKRGDNRGERALSIINQCSIIINLLTP